jgi:hypothetical protein
MVVKASGEEEAFSVRKLRMSLRRSGADDQIIDEIVRDIESWLEDGVTTRKIYARAFSLLRRKKRVVAARYSLKKAIMEMGPTGHPFEHLVGQVFKHWGYEVKVGQTVEGMCVNHEVDVLFTGDKEQGFVECKYYNSGGKYANVQVPMYIRSRVNDIINKRELLPQFHGYVFHGWVVTNTRFTVDAEKFGICSGLNLMSWDFPKGNSLKENIEKYNFFPITVLTELTKSEKHQLLERGIVLCRQLKSQPEELHHIPGLDKRKSKRVMQEVIDLCNG